MQSPYLYAQEIQHEDGTPLPGSTYLINRDSAGLDPSSVQINWQTDTTATVTLVRGHRVFAATIEDGVQSWREARTSNSQ